LWNQDHYTESFPGLAGFTSTETGGGRDWLGRLGGGCDYQLSGNLSRWVIGAFADYDFMSLSGTNAPTDLLLTTTGPSLLSNERETGAWAGGARIGYLLTPSILTYFDGGFTQTRFTPMTVTTSAFPVGGATPWFFPGQTYSGWFLGGGTETALTDFIPGLPSGLFLRTEYRFSSYQSQDVTLLFTSTGAPTAFAEHITPYVQTITTSLVWRFNLPVPMIGPNH
jgi:outer membrane immunogenic protein